MSNYKRGFLLTVKCFNSEPKIEFVLKRHIRKNTYIDVFSMATAEATSRSEA